MNAQFGICIVIFILMILGYMQNKVSKTVVALTAMVALVLTGCLEAKTALAGFSNSNTIVMATMFIVSEGLSRTQAVHKVSALVNKISNGSFSMILFGYVLITMLLAQISGSSSAAFAIMFPIVFAMCDNMGFSRSKMLFAIGVVSIATCATIPIGGSAATYAQYNGFLESNGAEGYQLSFWDPMIARLPSLIAICLYAAFLAPKFSPDLPPVKMQGTKEKGQEQKKLSPFKEVVGYGTFVFVIIGLLLADSIQVPSWIITLIGALFICATGVLSSKEAYAAASLGGIVMMYVGVLAMGNALTATGAGEAVGAAVAKMIGNTTNGYIIGLVFFFVPFILTQFMNNRAVSNIFAPIAILTCNAIGCNPIGPMLLTLSGSLASFMTPMATATVNMVMGLGGYSQKDMIKMSILPSVILIIVNVVWIMTIYPAF